MGKPLLDVLRDVVLDPAEQAAFTDDPSAYLEQYGYEDVAPDDLSEAFGLVADTLPPDVAQAVASTSPAAAAIPVEDLVDDAEGSAFGEVTQDFDAVADGVEGLVDDDDFSADFGTGEVAEIEVDALDDVDADAFGVGSEADAEALAGGGFGGGSGNGEGAAFTSTSSVDTFDDTSFDDGDFGAEAVDGVDDDGAPGVEIPDGVDGTADGSYDGGDDDLGDHLDDVELPDDPGDFLDDIGSF